MWFALSVVVLVTQWLAGWWIGLKPRRIPRSATALADVAVVIPARNEAHSIGALVRALVAAGVREPVVVDDHSTDDTASTAAAAGARVVTGAELPSGWNGKAWACQQGADATSAPTLVFLDADVVPGSDVVARIAKDASDGALVSVQPHHVAPKFGEQLAAASNLVVLLGSSVTGIRPTPATRVAFGPCLAVTRTTYERLGGHAAVRALVPEDLALARLARRSGIPVRGYVGDGDLTFRMYPQGFTTMVRGFTRNIAAGGSAVVPLRLLGVVWWIVGLVSALAALLSAPFGGTADVVLGIGAFLAFTLQWAVLLGAAGSFGLVNTLLYPCSLAVFFVACARSLWVRVSGGTVQWRGRAVAIRLEER